MTAEISNLALRKASEWFARMQSDAVSARDHVGLADWLAESSENRSAYQFVADTCRLAARAHAPEVVDASQVALRIAPARAVPAQRWALAAGLVATVVSGGAYLALREPTAQQYQTAVGEMRAITLPDGSALMLNGATRLSVRFSHRGRDLELVDGEVYIVVGQDPARPFRVHAGNRTIRDVGTAFDIDMNGGNVDVSVGEGEVVILPPGMADLPAISGGVKDSAALLKGQALTYRQGVPLGGPRSVASREVGAWQTGVRTYDHIPLEWLVADLNRQFDGAIAIPDADLAAMEVTLTLKLHDRDTTIGTLEKLLPVQAIRHGPGMIELVRR